jgi:hypothetical protein
MPWHLRAEKQCCAKRNQDVPGLPVQMIVSLARKKVVQQLRRAKITCVLKEQWHLILRQG